MTQHLPVREAPPPACFFGFTRATYTPIPDQAIDDWLPDLCGAELKVFLYVCRRTLGFQKVSDNISLHQLQYGLVKKNGERLDRGTGLSKPALLKALRDLQDKGIIETVRRASSDRGDEATNYRICFAVGVVPPLVARRVPEALPLPAELVGWRRPGDAPRGKESLPGGRETRLTTPVVKKAPSQDTEIQEPEEQETALCTITLINNSIETETAAPVVVAFPPAEERSTGRMPNCTEHTAFVLPSPPPDSAAPPSPPLARQQTGATALITMGIASKVAYLLAQRHSLKRIEEKLDYLDFLQQYEPDKVKNPRGWLRAAIEEDYAAPDGYLSPEQQQQRTQQVQVQAEAFAHEAQWIQKAHQEAAEAQKAARQQRIQEEYGTTAADRTLWQAAQQNISYMGRPDIYGLIVDAEILQGTDDRVLIGVATEAKLRRLSHPVTQAAIKRGLSQAASRSLTPQFELLAQSCDP